MNLFLPRKRHLVTAVPAVVYAVNYPIIIQVISEIQEKSCAFVETQTITYLSLIHISRAPQYVFEAGVPVFGVCYGMQTMAMQLGGHVR